MYKRQKVPARKRVRCYANGRPYLSHKDEYWAEQELKGLCEKFKTDNFEIFTCEHCGKLHVRRKNGGN